MTILGNTGVSVLPLLFQTSLTSSLLSLFRFLSLFKNSPRVFFPSFLSVLSTLVQLPFGFGLLSLWFVFLPSFLLSSFCSFVIFRLFVLFLISRSFSLFSLFPHFGLFFSFSPFFSPCFKSPSSFIVGQRERGCMG